jgi:hypothetical protein
MKSLSLLIGLVTAVASATASPILYNINFTGGPALPVGSFMFDAATSTFSAFNVSFNGANFNLTGSANGPFVTGSCSVSASASADLFAALNGNCGPRAWQAESPGPGNFFRMVTGNLPAFSACGGGGLNGACVQSSQNNGGVPGTVDGSGSYTVSAATPEPASMILTLSSIALLIMRRARRK